MERFVIIVNGWKSLTIITKPSMIILKNCLRYLQTTLVRAAGMLVSELMQSIVAYEP